MHTEIYCAALDQLNRTTAIRAIHQAYLQLAALDANVDCEHYDNSPALGALLDCLRDAGHPAGEAQAIVAAVYAAPKHNA